MTLTTPRQSRGEDASRARAAWTAPVDGLGTREGHGGSEGGVDAFRPSGVDLVALNAGFEGAASEEILVWAFGEFGPTLSVVSSFQNCVLVDLATQIDSRAEIIFLDTGSHFAETLGFVEKIRQLYDLNLRIIRPGADAETWPCGSERCCELRKVVPLARALRGRLAWVSGLKRSDTLNRASSPIVGWDSAQGLVKINPLACWTNDDVSRYEADHRLPLHPLKARGYSSIGCEPTTRPVSPFEDPRAGRWPGTEKTECGLHV
jgi:phosphoadenosine phosphosulfate reductase